MLFRSADDWVPLGDGSSDRNRQGVRAPAFKEYSRYEKSPSGEWRLKGRLRNRCKRLWQTAVLTSDSIVVPCCFDKRAEFPMGNAGEMDFRRIWKGPAYRDFRKQILTERKSLAICMNCTEGNVNIVPILNR